MALYMLIFEEFQKWHSENQEIETSYNSVEVSFEKFDPSIYPILFK